jgi:predicted phage terminase large subunit-like protein
MNVSNGLWVPAKHLAMVNRKITEIAYSETSRFLMVSMPPRHGKQMQVRTHILTSEGWKRAGDLRLGDRVFSPSGKPTKVVAVSPVDVGAPKMRVVMTDGSTVDVHPNHEWTVYDRGRHRWRTMETREIARQKYWSGDRARFQLPDVAALEMPEAELPLAPYLLGLWLGDGTAAKGTIAMGADRDELVGFIEADGDTISNEAVHRVTGVHYPAPARMQRRLSALGVLRNKHIPESYLLSSVRQRRLLLQGIVDSDGSVDPNGRVRVIGHDRRLMDDVLCLVRTLGHKASMWTETDTREPHELNGHSVKTAGTRYVVGWSPIDGLSQGRLARKRVICRPTKRRIGIKSIESAPNADGVCIQVAAPDGLFLVGRELIPTHNSFLISRYFPAWFLGMFPDKQVILTSYEADFAAAWGRQARDVLEEHGMAQFGIRVSAASSAAARWDIQGHLGGMRAVGMGGPLTGKGGHIIVIDDPVKGWEESQSDDYRNKQWDWYLGTLRTRLEPGGSIILLMCLAGDSLVPVVGKGSVPISQIVPGDEVYAYSEEGLTRRRVLAQRRSGVGETITIATHRHQLTATPTHPFLVVPADGRARPAYAPVWRPAASLTVGDLVVTSAALPTSGAAPVDGWTDPEWAWLLGYLVGDGWVTTWPKHNKDHVRSKVYDSRAWAVFVALGENATLNERAADLIYSIFGRRPKAHLAEGYQRLDSAEAGRTLTALGLVPGVRAPAKRVPLWLFDAPGETQLAFLRGLLDADGHKDKIGHAWTLASSSLELCGDVCRLALCCGARPAGPWTEKGRWRQPPNSPSPVWSQGSHVTIVMPEDDQRGRSLVTGRIPPDVRLERVQKITPGPILDVYDLTVDGEANFVAEGFVVHNTRWNEDDLAGRMEFASAENPMADQWESLNLPALAEPTKAELEGEIDTETWRDSMGRKMGEALWPGRWNREVLLQVMETLKEEKWGAEYQQRPSNPKGDMFPVEKWQYCDAPPAGTKLMRSWDLAATVKKASGVPDWTAGVLMGVNNDTGATYVVDARRKREDPLATEQFVADTAREDAEVWHCKRIRIPQDPGQAGKSQANYWVRKILAGYAVEATLDSGDKVTRAQPLAAQQRAGNCFLVRGQWNKAYIDEFRSFGPTGAKSAHDDWVDASSAAYGEITGIGVHRRVRLIL